MWGVVEFCIDFIAWSTSPTSFWAAALNHESRDDAMEASVVVKSTFGEGNQIADMARGIRGVEHE